MKRGPKHGNEKILLNKYIRKYMNLRTKQREAEQHLLCDENNDYWHTTYINITEQMNDVHFEILKQNAYLYGLRTNMKMLTEEGQKEEREFRKRMLELGLIRPHHRTGATWPEEIRKKIGEGKRRNAAMKKQKND